MAEGAGAEVEKAAKDPVQAAVAVADAWIRHPRGAHPGCAGEEVAAAVVGEAGPTTRTAEAPLHKLPTNYCILIYCKKV